MAPTDPTPSAKPRLVSMEQASAYASPWSRGLRFKTLLWIIGWNLLCRWTPKYFWRWRILVLKCFGVRITGKPFIASSAIIKFPWNLTLEDRPFSRGFPPADPRAIPPMRRSRAHGPANGTSARPTPSSKSRTPSR